ncbi:lamin tail domain-containing protein [Streptomyces sp. NBC_00846]|uniref:lamin tail domain-containing protein n=1 Tax=Streptomyces sp. NBC_00846 TaxID=2975849 RepID=UPI00386E3897|nr:lamin tail domain-containing protein [Streptomyces sp. NBC_00846]
MSRSARRFTAAVLASGALVAAAALPATADEHGHGHRRTNERQAVVLGAIQYNSPGRYSGSNRSLNSEWVTVTNTGRHAVNLRGWTLSDESRRTYRFNLRLAGRSSVRVHTGIGRDTDRDVYQDLRRHVWDACDTATLRDANGRRVDSKSWGRDRDRAGRNGHDGRNGHQGRDHGRNDGHDGRNGHQGRDHGRNDDHDGRNGHQGRDHGRNDDHDGRNGHQGRDHGRNDDHDGRNGH